MMMKRFFGFSLLLLPFFLMGGVGLWAQVAGAVGDAGAGELGVKEEVGGVRLILVRSVGGEEVYEKRLEEEEALWLKAAAGAGVGVDWIHPADGAGAREKLGAALAGAVAAAPDELWVVLMGHGTYDGREAKFNLSGEDVTPAFFAEALGAYEGLLVFIHTGSASAPFLQVLGRAGAVVVSATKSGEEVFWTRFGLPFAEAMGGLEAADLDQDQQVSVLEAFLYASDVVRQFYLTEERIATEHALLEDNGDGVATRSEAFDGLRARVVAQANGPVADGRLARQTVLVPSEQQRRLNEVQRGERDALERRLEELKGRREELGEGVYYERVEAVLRALGELLLPVEAEDGEEDQ